MSRRSFRERINDRDVVFGDPWRQALGLALQPATRTLILTSPRKVEQGQEIAAALGDRGAAVAGLARQHVPRQVVEDGLSALEASGADSIVTFGGGSAIGLGKALKRARAGALRFVAIVTTFSGSEMTDYYGIRGDGGKEVGLDGTCRPDVVIYDPDLLIDLPPAAAVPSLFNAMAHAVDALYPSSYRAETGALAKDAISALATAARGLAETPDDREVLAEALFGGFRAGAILGRARLALHHELAHVLGGRFDMPHAETHTALLPHVIAFNAGATAHADGILAAALEAGDPAGAMFDLAAGAGADMRLSAHGFRRDHVADAAAAVAAAAGRGALDNPRPALAEDIASLLDDARLGRRPSIDRRLDTPQTGTPPHGGIRPLVWGTAPEDAGAGAVIVHGRGSTAERVWRLFEPAFAGLEAQVSVLVVQADDRSWYPHPFDQPVKGNQPGFDSACAVIAAAIDRLTARGLSRERIALMGFSQGACVALDLFASRGEGLGGAVGIAGALIGDPVPDVRHRAKLSGIPCVTGAASRDRWVSRDAVEASRAHLRSLGAAVRAVDHDSNLHTITTEQLEAIRALVEGLLSTPSDPERAVVS